MIAAQKDVTSQFSVVEGSHNIAVKDAGGADLTGANFLVLTNASPGAVDVKAVQVTSPTAAKLSITSLATNTDGKGLRAALLLTVRQGGSPAECTPGGFNNWGTVTYGPAAVGGEPAITLTGTRPQLSATPFWLCFKLELPAGLSPVTYSGAQTQDTWTFIGAD
jgi:hypothetical protein